MIQPRTAFDYYAHLDESVQGEKESLESVWKNCIPTSITAAANDA